MESNRYAGTQEVASLLVVRLYEGISFLLVLGGLWYVWRSRNPVNYGVYTASSLGGGVMEWVFDSKYYFRLTTDERFIAAWTMAGEGAPMAMILFYAFFFGIPLMLLQRRRKALYEMLGYHKTHLFVALFGAVATPIFECTNTSVAHIYKYHQRDEYLFYGMPYSNFWFGAMMMELPFLALEQAYILVDMLSRTGLPVWKQKVLAYEFGFGAVISAFFVASTINGIWYALAGDIWTPTPRMF